MSTVRLVVSTSEQLAPIVSELLFDAGAQGLEEHTANRRSATAKRGTPVTLVTYSESRSELTALWARVETALAAALSPAQLPRARIEADRAQTWRTAWTDSLEPVALTRRLVLCPTTREPPSLRPSQRLIWYRPALAFGDGDHPTTRLAARAIERHYQTAPGGALLDIGAGTGVLSFVAVLSGARRAVGIDISPDAVEASRVNAGLNGLDKQTRFLAAAPRATSATFDVTVVNIELRPLLTVLATLPAAARRAPKLLVTGFLASQLAEVTKAVKAAGFRPRSRKAEGEWRLLEAQS
jgi:ribosomal protein L11 methyltransferase